MTPDQIWQTVHAQRAARCDLLDEDQWRQPSLCAGWTVRDVVAHLTLQQLGPGAVLARMLQWRRIDRTTAHVDAADRRGPPVGGTAASPAGPEIRLVYHGGGHTRSVQGSDEGRGPAVRGTCDTA